MKEVEAWGGGVSLYFTACSASGLPPPTISEEAGVFKVVFWRKLKEAKGIFEGGVPLVENNMPCNGTLNLNKAVGIARRVRVGQFQLPYDLPAA